MGTGHDGADNLIKLSAIRCVDIQTKFTVHGCGDWTAVQTTPLSLN